MSRRMLFGWANFFGVWNFFAASLLTSLPHCWPIVFFTAPLRSCGLVCIALMLYDDQGIVWCSFSSDAARRIFINACQFLLVAGSIHCVLYRALRVLRCADVVAPPFSLLNVIWRPAWDWCFASVMDVNQCLEWCSSFLVSPVESLLMPIHCIARSVLHCAFVILHLSLLLWCWMIIEDCFDVRFLLVLPAGSSLMPVFSWDAIVAVFICWVFCTAPFWSCSINFVPRGSSSMPRFLSAAGPSTV